MQSLCLVDIWEAFFCKVHLLIFIKSRKLSEYSKLKNGLQNNSIGLSDCISLDAFDFELKLNPSFDGRKILFRLIFTKFM